MKKSNLKPLVIEVSEEIFRSLDSKYIARKQKEYAKFGYKVSFKKAKKAVKIIAKAAKKDIKQFKKNKKKRDIEKAKKLREEAKQKKFIDSMNDRLKKHFTDENRNIYVKNLKDVKGLVIDKDGLISYESKIDSWTEKSLKEYIPDKRHKIRESEYMVDSLLSEVKDEYYEDKKKLDAITDSAELKLKTKESDFETKTKLIKKLGSELNHGEYKKAEVTKKKLMKYYSKKSKTTVRGE